MTARSGRYGFLEIDHLVGAATHLQRAGEQYERLGFTVTPLSVIESLGVGNRLILLHPPALGVANFFECMGIVDERRVAPRMKELLSGRDGARWMVLSGTDANASFEALSRDGYPFAPPLDIEREWRLPSGEALRPSYRVTLPIDAPLKYNFIQYRALHPYLRDEWLRHANGARAMTRVYAIAPDPHTVAGYFGRVFGSDVVSCGDALAVGPGAVTLVVGDVATLRGFIPPLWLAMTSDEPRYLGLEIEVESLPVTRTLLSGRGVRFTEHGAALVVAPEEACGNVIRFVASPARADS